MKIVDIYKDNKLLQIAIRLEELLKEEGCYIKPIELPDGDKKDYLNVKIDSTSSFYNKVKIRIDETKSVSDNVLYAFEQFSNFYHSSDPDVRFPSIDVVSNDDFCKLISSYIRHYLDHKDILPKGTISYSMDIENETYRLTVIHNSKDVLRIDCPTTINKRLFKDLIIKQIKEHWSPKKMKVSEIDRFTLISYLGEFSFGYHLGKLLGRDDFDSDKIKSYVRQKIDSGDWDSLTVDECRHEIIIHLLSEGNNILYRKDK